MDIMINFGILVPVVMGVTEVIKRGAGLKKRYVPFAALILGIIGAMVVMGFEMSSVIPGVIAGLSASGLWSGVKSTFGA